MNQTEFLRLIGDNKGILYKIAASYCRNTGDRDDLIQEMIYQLWASAPDLGTIRLDKSTCNWNCRST